MLLEKLILEQLSAPIKIVLSNKRRTTHFLESSMSENEVNEKVAEKEGKDRTDY